MKSAAGGPRFVKLEVHKVLEISDLTNIKYVVLIPRT